MKLDWLKIWNGMRSFHGFPHHLLILLIRIFHVILNMFPNVVGSLDPVLKTFCIINGYTRFPFVDFSSNLALNTKWTTASTNGIPNEVSLFKRTKIILTVWKFCEVYSHQCHISHAPPFARNKRRGKGKCMIRSCTRFQICPILRHPGRSHKENNSTPLQLNSRIVITLLH